jgi:RNA recognition motif-containing protein
MASDDLTSYIQHDALYVKGIPLNYTKEEIISVLSEKVCPAHLGKVVVPNKKEITESRHAYLNYNSDEDAKSALKKYRFDLKIGNTKLVLTPATKKHHGSDYVFRSHGSKFMVYIKNISEDTTEKDIYDKLSQYGDIMQCIINSNRIAIVQFMKLHSVQDVLDNSDMELGGNKLIFDTSNNKKIQGKSDVFEYPKSEILSSALDLLNSSPPVNHLIDSDKKYIPRKNVSWTSNSSDGNGTWRKTMMSPRSDKSTIDDYQYKFDDNSSMSSSSSASSLSDKPMSSYRDVVVFDNKNIQQWLSLTGRSHSTGNLV